MLPARPFVARPILSSVKRIIVGLPVCSAAVVRWVAVGTSADASRPTRSRRLPRRSPSARRPVAPASTRARQCFKSSNASSAMARPAEPTGAPAVSTPRRRHGGCSDTGVEARRFIKTRPAERVAADRCVGRGVKSAYRNECLLSHTFRKTVVWPVQRCPLALIGQGHLLM